MSLIALTFAFDKIVYLKMFQQYSECVKQMQ